MSTPKTNLKKKLKWRGRPSCEMRKLTSPQHLPRLKMQMICALQRSNPSTADDTLLSEKVDKINAHRLDQQSRRIERLSIKNAQPQLGQRARKQRVKPNRLGLPISAREMVAP